LNLEKIVHCDVIGEGDSLVLLHGWGVNSIVWQPVVEALSQHFKLYLVDLPGFGRSAPLSEYSLESITEAVLQVVPKSATWCGWSLGGLIATYAAVNHPQRVNKLIQVACSVKFVADETWQGVDKSVFDNFLLGLKTNPQKTLTRFIALQAMGSLSARKDSALLKKLLSGTNEPDQEALIAGLKLLSESDLRSSFVNLSLPCLSLFGQFDSLVPIQIKQNMQTLAPSIESQLFEKSSHALFVSENELFCQRVISFICD
jgi:pimeloyl-[acyl-carrier protein] methyl ester esterase